MTSAGERVEWQRRAQVQSIGTSTPGQCRLGVGLLSHTRDYLPEGEEVEGSGRTIFGRLSP